MAGKLFGKPRENIIKHPGAFSAKAAKSGMSTAEYARKVLSNNSKASPVTRKQAGLDKAFQTMRNEK